VSLRPSSGQALGSGSGQALEPGSGPVISEAVNGDDLALVRRAQAGDVEAFGELVERHRRAVFRAALAAVRSPADADEVTQDAFVTAFQKLDGFRGEASFKTWLLAITWRKGIDRRKSVTKFMQRLVSPGHGGDEGEEWDPMERVPAAGQTQEDEAITSDLQRRLKPLIAGLPKKLRDALLLAGSGDHSYPEIARMLGIPLGTLKWRVCEARKVLRRKMVALGYDDV
jgi:RNA polymerase sigma-70 factor (ECF subfamily)